MNLNPTADEIATAAISHQYDDITSRDELIAFADSFPPADASTPLRARLISMIDLDLNDMLHNNNLDFFASLDDLDTLTDAQFEQLSDHLLDATDPAIIADLLLARYPAI
jgi:hypothetical protein